MELSQVQKMIVEAPEDKIIVTAGAGAGKTRCMTERVRHLLKNNVNPNDIAVITFTNMAANELKTRLEKDYKDGLHISTIHSLANYFLIKNGIDTSEIIEKENFDDFFSLLKKYPECVEHIPYILADEFQDFSQLEYDFIFNMIRPQHFFLTGDINQSIFSFRGAEPNLMKNLMNDSEVKLYYLGENYRCGSNILRFAKNILRGIGMEDNSISKKSFNGVVTETNYDINKIYEYFKQIDNYGDWAILCRSNSTISTLSNKLEEQGIPTITFKQGNLTNAELDTIMKSNKVKILTVHSAKGLTFKNVIVCEIKWWKDEEYRINYVAATRASDRLVWMKDVPKRKRKKSWEEW